MSRDATSESDQLQKGRECFLAERYAKALTIVEDILGATPFNVEALNLAGAAAWQLGDTAQALHFLDVAIQHHPSHPDSYLTLGVILEHHGKINEAHDAYTASLQAEPNQIIARVNLGNTLVKMGRLSAAVAEYDHVLHRDSKNIDALCNKGMALKNKGQYDEAEMVLRNAVRIVPQSDLAWTNLGLVLRVNGKPEASFKAYEQALKLNPKSIHTQNNLAVLHRWQGNLDAAETLCRSILNSNPDVIEVLNNLGDILQAQGHIDKAKAAFERVLELNPDHPEGHHNLAVLLLLKGDFKRGWEHYEWRWLAKEFPSERRNFSQPLWAGEGFSGQTILLYVEQGLGDAIQFVRYAPLVKALGGTVLVECPKVLVRLFANVSGIDRILYRGEDLPQFDIQCPFLSLPGLLSRDESLIPSDASYIGLENINNPQGLDRLKSNLGIKVGLVWAGSPHHTNDRERSIALESLGPITSVQGCTFISLQIGPRSDEVKSVTWPIIDITSAISDYADTADLVSQLDLVITVDTSVAHLAGAMGIPVWVLLPHAPDWRWQINRTDSPWYPTMVLYRQPCRRDWVSVINKVKEDLIDFVAHKI